MAPDAQNARDLPWLAAIGIDFSAAFGAAFCVAPVISMM